VKLADNNTSFSARETRFMGCMTLMNGLLDGSKGYLSGGYSRIM